MFYCKLTAFEFLPLELNLIGDWYHCGEDSNWLMVCGRALIQLRLAPAARAASSLA
jgi:hypothetical protein